MAKFPKWVFNFGLFGQSVSHVKFVQCPNFEGNLFMGKRNEKLRIFCTVHSVATAIKVRKMSILAF